jgi:hypothetical protein
VWFDEEVNGLGKVANHQLCRGHPRHKANNQYHQVKKKKEMQSISPS